LVPIRYRGEGEQLRAEKANRPFVGDLERTARNWAEEGAAAKLQHEGERVGFQEIANHDGRMEHESGDSWRMSHYERRNAPGIVGSRRASPKENPFKWRSSDERRSE
jgi:hypothetical protein